MNLLLTGRGEVFEVNIHLTGREKRGAEESEILKNKINSQKTLSAFVLH